MRYLMCVALLYCASGCSIIENAMKSGVSIGLDAGKAWAEAQVGKIPDEAMKFLEDKANAGIDKVMTFAAEKAAAAADAGFFAALRAVGVNPWDFDSDGDGKLSEVERAAALETAKNQEDQPWWAGLLLAGATLAFTGGKSWRRYAESKRKTEAAEIAEGVVNA